MNKAEKAGTVCLDFLRGCDFQIKRSPNDPSSFGAFAELRPELNGESSGLRS